MNSKLKKIFSFAAKNEWEEKQEKKHKPLKINDALKLIPIFANLNKREIKLLIGILHNRSYTKNEFVCMQGDPGLGMYVVIKGEVEVFIEENDNNKKSLAILGEGEFFGELSLIDKSPRSATVMATKNSELLGFFQPDLLEINHKYPTTGLKIIFKISELLAERLRQTNEKLSIADSKTNNPLKKTHKRSKNENSSKEE